ncbi:DNA polymerase III subunit delta' [Sphingorhabdus wooponensis]|jgi:DNA polymerase-3 subunit delta'|uniref:DNA polymerase III subunit delta n=1 Tax=Sphingorhabdus wooponensis TaxID=940136 RepID=A0A3R8Q8T0_9SPHN|nr:DNA polymerase III subunit delta' [Sphingorhabdus wooponensis]RRQ52174.1 DNA polymerase III subunit delta' [Sphingorhabdus wooponensis]
MNDYVGHDKAWRQFATACDSGKIHHGWILSGPRGIGKSAFALRAAAMLVDPENAYASMIARGSHPDILSVKRLPKEPLKEDEVIDDATEFKRSITVDQIRGLQQSLTTRPGLSNRRAIIIDSADDLERGGANALLKSLEEPPVGTFFFLISHASDRLLPTIRSRCQILRFEALDDADMAHILQRAAPEVSADQMQALIRLGNGTPGQALDFLGLDLKEIEDAMMAIVRTGDRDNALRSNLADKLALKAAQPRYEAFLRRAPSLIAEYTRKLDATQTSNGVAAWEAASGLAARAIALSLDKQSVVFQMGSLLASIQTHTARP